MKRIPNYREHVNTTDDIEFLRTELLCNHDLTNKLHRRIQEKESLISQLNIKNTELTETLERVRNYYDGCKTSLYQLENVVNTLPFPIHWFIKSRLKEINNESRKRY